MVVPLLSEVQIEENRLGANHSTLIAPAIGAAVEEDFVEMAVIGLMWAVADPDAAREIVAKRVAAAVDKHHGVFVGLGISAAG